MGNLVYNALLWLDSFRRPASNLAEKLGAALRTTLPSWLQKVPATHRHAHENCCWSRCPPALRWRELWSSALWKRAGWARRWHCCCPGGRCLTHPGSLGKGAQSFDSTKPCPLKASTLGSLWPSLRLISASGDAPLPPPPPQRGSPLPVSDERKGPGIGHHGTSAVAEGPSPALSPVCYVTLSRPPLFSGLQSFHPHTGPSHLQPPWCI